MRFITEKEVSEIFPVRPSDCHKGDWGYVAMIGGSIEYSGAIRLAAIANSAMRSGEACMLAAHANSAMRAGAGVATVAAPGSICPLIAPQILEATLIPLSDNNGRLVFREEDFIPIASRYDCISFGMGIGNTAEVRKAVEWLLMNYEGTLIVDADGLNAMSELDHGIIRGSSARLVLTPHLKEFSRLSGITVADAGRDPVAAALSLSEELDAVVLLKGSTTVVAGKGSASLAASMDRTGASRGQNVSERTAAGECGSGCIATDKGCPGMATAGSGDVLSGILSAICAGASDEDLVTAVCAGAYINGAAGELAQSRRCDITMTSHDTALCVAEVIENIIRKYR